MVLNPFDMGSPFGRLVLQLLFQANPHWQCMRCAPRGHPSESWHGICHGSARQGSEHWKVCKCAAVSMIERMQRDGHNDGSDHCAISVFHDIVLGIAFGQ
mmetsp:Transcript_75087/g.140062  ORF Transcript_75087/g.140062 Transcript_75087/m.140062 type:complete len:100 (-) Transcript_75087:35-334(-)